MSDPRDLSTSEPRKRRSDRAELKLGVALAGLLALLLVAGSLATASLAQAAGWWGRHHGGHGEMHDPERALEHADYALGFVLSRVDASDEQQAAATAIVADAMEDLFDLREAHGAFREAFVAELTRPTIDRAALEALRAEQLELAEVASTRLIEAIADLAEVLTPEQRQELVDMAESFHR